MQILTDLYAKGGDEPFCGAWLLLPQYAVSKATAQLSHTVLAVALRLQGGHFAYNALHNKDTLHIKHYIIRTLYIIL